MRFHLDEHVAHAIAAGLRRRGIDVTTTVDAGLLSAPDEEHLAFAKRDARVIVTQDSDFLRPTTPPISASPTIRKANAHSAKSSAI
jgi:predicted nuclease of predicted toxin-antitoxin system